MPAKSPRSGTPPTPMSSYSIGLPREAQDSLTLRNCGECPPPMSMQQGWGWVETTGDWAAETDLLKLELWAELKSQKLPQTNQQRQETSFDSKILNPATFGFQWVCSLQVRQVKVRLRLRLGAWIKRSSGDNICYWGRGPKQQPRDKR